MPLRIRNFCNRTRALPACAIALLWFACPALAASPVQTETAPNGSANTRGETGTQQDEADEAAWEYRPYKVVVWLVHDNSWRIRSSQPNLIEKLDRRARLADPSGWQVGITRAPHPWNYRLLKDWTFDNQQSISLQDDIRSGSFMPDADKLIVVRMEDELGMFRTSVREFDVKTRVWGARVQRRTDFANLAATIFDSMKTAFMPVTRIENVQDSDVLVRVRAIGISNIGQQDDDGDWEMVPNTGSPVWIAEDEIMLPVILRNDRRGNIDSITPVEWTFLSIKERDGPHLDCTTHSMRRAPLGGRTGGRTERLALCVRAPNRKTVLKLLSNDKLKDPLPDLEVYSRRPGMEKEEDSEFLGKTDWRGEITIPPNEDRIRILYVKSGRRPLARVPLVPGLYDYQMATMPNDERRLYAEGVIRGLENELMDHVARRQILTERVKMALERNDLDHAGNLLRKLRDVPTAQTFSMRLSREKKVLLFGDDRQRKFIDGYFKQLETAASSNLKNLEESRLNQQLQAAKRNQ